MTLPSSGPLSLSDIQGEFGGSNPISLNEYYAGGGLVPSGTTGTYGAVPSSGQISIQNFYGTSAAIFGSITYSTAGTYTWVAPTCVTKVSVVAVGAGSGRNGWCCEGMAGGGGGALAYKNNITVTPGSSYTVVAGAFTVNASGGNSSFNGCCVKAGGGTRCYTPYRGGAGGTVIAGTGYAGGNGASVGGAAAVRSGAGGAGGYAGKGGNGGGIGSNGSSGAGGGGGGGSVFSCGSWISGTGGGVGLFGQGSSGAGGTYGSSSSGVKGQAGSGGSGVLYGGGGCACGGTGGRGAVRILWPGNTRTFPSTQVCASVEGGSSLFINSGSFTWIAPAGVTSVSVVVIGGGGGGGYGVTTGIANSGNPSYFNTTTTVRATGGFGGQGNGCYAYNPGGSGGTATAGTGYSGGKGGCGQFSGGSDRQGYGGGAAGYTGNGGNGLSYQTSPAYRGGGGVGIFGGASGGNISGAGQGGSGGTNGSTCGFGVAGLYGGGGTGISSGSGAGGGGLAYINNTSVTPGSTYTVVVGSGGGPYSTGGGGAVRIVWPGSTRSFPSTNVCATKG